MFIEFSYPLAPQTVVLERSIKPPAVVPRSRLEAGGHSNTSYLELFAHAGTHIDTPWHFIKDGRRILDFEIADFVFSRVVLCDLSKTEARTIETDDLLPMQKDLALIDALLVRTGFGKLRMSEPERYISDTPGFSIEAANFLAGFPNIRCVGVDWISIENVALGRQTGFPIHHAFLGRTQPMILLEDANLAVLPEGFIQRISLFPIRFQDLEASPVTAVAEI